MEEKRWRVASVAAVLTLTGAAVGPLALVASPAGATVQAGDVDASQSGSNSNSDSGSASASNSVSASGSDANSASPSNSVSISDDND